LNGGSNVIKKLSIIVFSGDFDRVVAAFTLATGVAEVNWEVNLFLTFLGIDKQIIEISEDNGNYHVVIEKRDYINNGCGGGYHHHKSASADT
jgi:peroxiredoxin family protein